MDRSPEKPVLFFDIDNCLYSRNDKVLEHMGKNIDDYFKKHLGLSPDDAERLHKDYSQQYGQAIEGLVRHHQIDALEYNAKVDDAVPLDDLIKPNAQLRQFLEDIDTSKTKYEAATWAREFRAIWIQGNNFNHVKLSGVAVGHWRDPMESNVVPVDPNARYDGRQTDDDGFPIEVAEIFILNSFLPNHPPEWCWGFLFHDACWSLLNFEQQVDLGDLFRLCVSTPIGPDMLPNFGHDYGDIASISYEGAIEVLVSDFKSPNYASDMLRANPFEIPALRKSINFAARMQQDAFQSILDRSTLSADKDVFNYFPPEILEKIVMVLPSPDVHSLRLASRVFATLSLSERFWASRFTEGHEFNYLPEVFATPPTSWRALYLSLHIWASENSGMGSRSRVWPSVKDLHETLRQMKDVDCLGNVINTVNEPEAPKPMPERESLITAERYIFEPGTHFMGGSRVLRARSAEFPQHLKIMLMSVSFVDTPAGLFISGLMFVGADGVFESLGYTNKSQMEHLTLPEDQHVKGFEVALDFCGFRAIAAITQDGTTSSWAGDPANYPRRRLYDVEGISLIVAQFDALKLVSLSRDRIAKKLQEPRDRLLWYPEIPPPEIFFDGLRPLDKKVSSTIPIMTAFFGENDGRYIRQVTSIDTHIYDWCHVDRISFEFMDDSIQRCLGDIEYETEQSNAPLRFPDHGSSMGHMDIDSGNGEEIESFEVQFDQGIIIGLKFNTNTNRTELVSNADDPFDLSWTKVTPRGKKIIGMFSQGAENEWGSSKRVLVTGGSGFLGGHVVRQLLEDAETTVAIVSRHPKMPADVADESRVSLHAADLTIPSQIEHVFETFKPHAVIHTASPSYIDTPANLIKANIDGTKALLKAASACADTHAFVFTSSDSAVIPTQEPLLEEDSVLYDETNAPNTYAMSKAAAERLVISSNSEQLWTAAIRIPATYGECDMNFVRQLVQSIRRNEHKMQVGNDTKVFEFLYVKKAAEAHILAMKALLDSEKRDIAGGQAFFISDGKPHKFFDFSRKLYAAAGHPVELEEVTKIPFFMMQAMASTAEWVYWIMTLGYIKPAMRRSAIDHLDSGCCWSLDKAKRVLGYEPVADQDEAIRKTMEWGMKAL
ncbi:C-3 sterol dehydrogenase (C-4 decarboxylase) [Fusarium napiforme]|uniref:C-3 sterol dehydrogenase (C-4 decarboxylase) n=1 Tax=Fusarium napiforme TaxID=42672 RepID=A0A8H5JXR9_9HYPO|nr:C-3 sterol dehydrogenase (C-4 decarboxylase) [Fusarium napiforme]